jgi:hypothetical protein
VWRANLSDGTVLWERDPKTHQEHKFGEIDQSKLISFDLLLPIKDMEDVKLSETDIQVKTLDDTAAIVSLKVYSKTSIPFYHLELQKDQRIIFSRRRQMTSGRKIAIIPTKSGEIRIPFPIPSGQRIIIIGWQRKIGKENVQAITYIFPDGRIEMSGAWGEDATHKEVNMNIVDESKITLDLKETTISADAKLIKK